MEDDTDWVAHANKTEKYQQNLSVVLGYGDRVRLDPSWHLYEMYKREWYECDEAIYYGLDDDETLILRVEPLTRPGIEDIWAGSLMYHDGTDWKPVYDILGFPS